MSEVDPNRRESDRVSQKGYVTVTILDAPEAPLLVGSVFRCTTRDLSKSGVQIQVHSYVPVGSKLHLLVSFVEPEASFDHVARVVWCRVQDEGVVQSHSMGLEFVYTSSETGHVWEDLLRSRMLGARQAPLS